VSEFPQDTSRTSAARASIRSALNAALQEDLAGDLAVGPSAAATTVGAGSGMPWTSCSAARMLAACSADAFSSSVPSMSNRISSTVRGSVSPRSPS